MRSLIYQTIDRHEYEIIVINDGSNDKTKFVANLFKDEIKIINNKKIWDYHMQLTKEY